ncbi:MAG: D-alanyl-D-alanine carboxypeptidase [Limnochordales bacterium]|nr:D-alanyl-D-alanine carboxypeptidase [Limnochordales bacterium]
MKVPAAWEAGHPFNRGSGRVPFLSCSPAGIAPSFVWALRSSGKPFALTLLWVLVLALTSTLSVWFSGGEPVKAAAPVFDVDVPSALLIDVDTGQVLYEKNADEKRSPASISKVMVMLLAMEAVADGRARLDDQVTISQTAESMGGSQLYLKAGTSFTLQELLEMLAIASANDATVAITEYLAGSEDAFVEAMNRRARELGMKDTVFLDASGLPLMNNQENVTTARDIGRMSVALIKKYPQVLEWTGIWTKQFRPDLPVAVNTNRLIRRYPGADGLKTGHTEKSGYSVVATAQRGDRRLLVVVLGATSDEARIAAASKLLDYGFTAFHRVLAVPAGTAVGNVEVAGGSPGRVEAVVLEDIRVLLPRIVTQEGVEQRLEPRQGLQAPVKKGDRVGELVLYYRGTEVGRHPVVAATDVRRAGLLARLWQWLRNLIAGLFR